MLFDSGRHFLGTHFSVLAMVCTMIERIHLISRHPELKYVALQLDFNAGTEPINSSSAKFVHLFI